MACFHCETESYICTGYSKIDEPKFAFAGGKGRFDIEQFGTFDIYFKKFDENISIQKPNIIIKNVILGSLTLDFNGQVEALNIKTRDVIILDLFEEKKALFTRN